MAFDTHASVKKLQEAGFTPQQAEAQVELLSAGVEGNLASKHDIELVRHDIELVRRDIKAMETGLRHDMREIEATLRHDMKEMESRITMRLGGIVVAGFALMTALLGVVIAMNAV